MTIEHIVNFVEAGMTPQQTDRLLLYRWLLIHEGRIGNRLAARDPLRIRQILPRRGAP